MHSQCVLKLRNQKMDKAVPVTAIDSHYNEKTGDFWLFQGDENGEVLVHDISVILTKIPNLHPIDVTKNNAKRNPHREFAIEVEEKRKPGEKKDEGNDSDDFNLTNEHNIVSLIKESEIGKVLTNEAADKPHQDAIRSIQFISVTEEPLIMTASYDRMVHIMNLNCEIRGTLKQGYKTIKDYEWHFEVENFENAIPEKKSRIANILSEVRQERDKILSHKKLAEIKLLKSGKLSTFGLTGSQLMGMENTTSANSNDMYNT